MDTQQGHFIYLPAALASFGLSISLSLISLVSERQSDWRGLVTAIMKTIVLLATVHQLVGPTLAVPAGQEWSEPLEARDVDDLGGAALERRFKPVFNKDGSE